MSETTDTIGRGPHEASWPVGILAWGGIALAADLTSKAWVQAHPLSVSVGPLTVTVVHNAGVAFGLGAATPGLSTGLSVLALLALVGCVFAVRRPTVRAALAVAAGGGAGNLVDRIVHGSVTDWIHVSGYPPTFNLADVFVRGGILAAIAFTVATRTPVATEAADGHERAAGSTP